MGLRQVGAVTGFQCRAASRAHQLGLLRLSAGLEDAGDLIADLDAALAVLDRQDLAAE
jgi:cystathionine beta-lyase/cystathionine gamma-synthase